MAARSVAAVYERVRRDGWALWLHRARWRSDWWQEVLAALGGGGTALSVSRHARTTIVSLSADEGTLRAFAKVYRPPTGGGAFKQLGRASKAVRALRVSLHLAADGFHVPVVLAAGERRRMRRLEHALLLTEEVAWPTAIRLAERLVQGPARRRAVLRALGAEVGRLHRLGYVHGDLVATNLLVDEGPPVRLCFLDHDRTRRRPLLGGWPSFRRNLIQLNRLPLPAVTHADRLRAFVAYAGARGWSERRRRREARSLAAATARRRRQLERIAARKAARAVS
jgi:hypothetical protein